MARIIKKSDTISLPGLAPARVGLAQTSRGYVTFVIKQENGLEVPIESSIMPAANMMVAQKQYTSRIRALEGSF